MLSLDKYSGTELRWFRRGFASKNHSLVGDNGETYAKLTVAGMIRSYARLETDLKQYKLFWSGFVRRRVKIVDLDDGQLMGELYLGITDSGEFRFDGVRYPFRHNLLGSHYMVTNDLGSPLFSIRDKLLAGKGLPVTLWPGARLNRQLLVMMASVRYALIMIRREAYAPIAQG